jgi:hypothetical protein
VTGKKEVILKRIIEFYIDSSEFKGMPHWQLHAEVGGSIQDVNILLEELLMEKMIHIKYAGSSPANQNHERADVEEISALKNWKTHEIEVYPAKSCL